LTSLTEPVETRPLPAAETGRPKRAPLQFIRDYLELSKSRIVLMVLITTAAGFLFAPGGVSPLLMLHTLVGTALVAAGTNALNQYVERDHDGRMQRTRSRPLPAGRITPRAALMFSSAIAIIGTLYLGVAVNWLTAMLGAFTLTSYIFVYTPLKRVSALDPLTTQDAISPCRLDTMRPRTPSPYGTAGWPCRSVPSKLSLPVTGLIHRRMTGSFSPGSPAAARRIAFPESRTGSTAAPCQRSLTNVENSANDPSTPQP
jgi:hypothetical protein